MTFHLFRLRMRASPVRPCTTAMPSNRLRDESASRFGVEPGLEEKESSARRLVRLLDEGRRREHLISLFKITVDTRISGMAKAALYNQAQSAGYRTRSRMHHNEYLANGWPIASGPVEGACKNRIKDRMERFGMRWTEQMAETMVQLRAIYPAWTVVPA